MQGPSEPLFPHALVEALRLSPASAAFEYRGASVSRAEVLELIRRLSGALRSAGLEPGAGLAVCTAVSPEAFAAQMAAHALGCRVVGVRPGYTAGQLAYVLGQDVDAVLVDQSTLTLELLRAVGDARLLSLGPCEPAADLLDRDAGGPLVIEGRPDDVAFVAFTSGSTGRPKGCALTYRALTEHWTWQPRHWSPVAREFAGAFERALLFGTLSSLVVLEFLAPCLLGGGTAVIPEDDGRPLFPYAIEKYQITGSIITVPRLHQMLDLLHAEPADVRSLRGLMVSGSPISPDRLAEAAARLGPVVYQGYGQTEAGNICMLTPADIAAGPAEVLGSVGRPHPRVEISVRDEEGRELPAGRQGEVYVRSPYQMAGYWAEPEETAQVLRDGWIRTRDLGRLDGHGLLHLSGRTRDVIMVNAQVVYAGPIERVLAAHPAILDAYVAGAPDDRGGEAVHAFVVSRAGLDLDHTTRAELAELVRASLGEESVPQTITVVPGVPVAPSGKPDKRALLRLHTQGTRP